MTPILPTGISPTFTPPTAAPNLQRANQPSFKEFLIEQIDHVNTMQHDADRAVEQFMTGGEVAVVARSQTRPPDELTWDELRDLVARCRAGLRRLGVARGDRVVGYLPNGPEATPRSIVATSPPRRAVAAIA